MLLTPRQVVFGHGLDHSNRKVTNAEALLSFFVSEKGKEGFRGI